MLRSTSKSSMNTSDTAAADAAVELRHLPTVTATGLSGDGHRKAPGPHQQDLTDEEDDGQPPAAPLQLAAARRRCGAKRPPIAAVYAGLVLAQLMFGGGNVLGKLGLSAHVNPLVFAFIRDAFAGPLLCVLAAAVERQRPRLADLPKFIWTGTFMFGNQLLFVLGLGLSSATFASAWQPTQPVFAALVLLCLGREKLHLRKQLGICVASGSAICMVATGAQGSSIYLASVCLFCNCVCAAMYVIACKPLLSLYPPITVLGWSYMITLCELAVTAALLAHDPGDWYVPPIARWVLAYWILCQSMGAFGLITWANQYVESSVVSSFATLAPAVTALLSFLVLGVVPEWRDLWSLGIIGGMLLVTYSNKPQQYQTVQDTDDTRV